MNVLEMIGIPIFKSASYNHRSAIYCYRVLLDQNPLSVEAVTRLAELGATRKQVEALKKDDRPAWMSDYIESVFCQQLFNFKGNFVMILMITKEN